MAGIFVSHASADGDFVSAFVDEIVCLGCGVPRTSVFFSYDPDTGVPVGADINEVVQRQISAEETLVLAVLTPTYFSRPYCLAELGAAWSRSGTLFPLRVPGVSHEELNGVLGGALVKSIGDAGALDALKERIVEMLGYDSPPTTWGRLRDRWVARLEENLRALTPPPAQILSSAACSREQGHMEIFWTNQAGEVFFRWWLGETGWSRVNRMRDVEAQHVAAVASDGAETLFGVKKNGEVWMRSWQLNERGWMVAGEVRGVAGLVSGPLSAIARGAEIELFAWSPDGKDQVHAWLEGERWTAWHPGWYRGRG